MSSKTLALVLVAVSAIACTSSQSTTPTITQAEAPRGCPLGVSGGTVTVENTPDGAALSFRSKNRVDEMRERANDAAAQHGPGQGLGRGHEGKHAEGGEHGLQVMQMPASRSVATDIEGGARIVFVAVNPADTESLRSKLRERASFLNAATCK